MGSKYYTKPRRKTHFFLHKHRPSLILQHKLLLPTRLTGDLCGADLYGHSGPTGILAPPPSSFVAPLSKPQLPHL